jgi:4-phospho-D-threonate 3-dehydrogenase / 4-phospho-D-erythronate 3-dehydrogenase
MANDPSGNRAQIAVTMGDAAGVGPELCLQLLTRPDLFGSKRAVPVIIGNYALLARVAEQMMLPFDPLRITEYAADLDRPTVLDLADSLDAAAVQPGANNAACGAAAARYIREAVEGCQQQRYAAMVTAPISKKALNMAGVNYPGHTEFLADLTATKDYAMLLYSEPIACAFVTCHQPLKSVSAALSIERIVLTAELAQQAMMALRAKPPRLCLLGLNPHAGEEGLFGDEEQRILIPAKRKIEEGGMMVEGPLPADTAFTLPMRRRFDCYISMYHDQGGIPFKMLAFDSGVNITMGLPIVRTSPDHGTAFDIAWKGKADASSFYAAYEQAVRLSGTRPNSGQHALPLSSRQTQRRFGLKLLDDE